ncbi:MAG TPA: nucleosidase [Nocardioides sp.]
MSGRDGVARRTDVLVVAATRAEAARVPTRFPLLVTGIGKVPAAAAVATVLARHEDPGSVHVVNVGTAGALRDGVTGLHLPGVVLNHDISAAALRALAHDPQERLELGTGDPGTVLASGDVFVTDPVVRERLAVDAPLVDMEGYAVAWAARAAGAHVTLVKHVSDNADDSAWDWPSQVAASAAVLGEWLETHLG